MKGDLGIIEIHRRKTPTADVTGSCSKEKKLTKKTDINNTLNVSGKKYWVNRRTKANRNDITAVVFKQNWKK